MSGSQLQENARGLTKRQKYLERIHLLRTLVNYGPQHASDLTDRANTECDGDAFDDLPEITRRGIGRKLQGMERDGLVAGGFLGTGLPRIWEIVEGGRNALAIFEQQDGDTWRFTSEPVRPDDPIVNGTRWREALERIVAEEDCVHWTGTGCARAMRQIALVALGRPIE